MENEVRCPVCNNIITDTVVLPCSHRICGQCSQGIVSHAIAHAGYGTANISAKETSVPANQSVRRPKLGDPESGYSTASNDSSNGKMQFYGGVNDVSEKGQRYVLGTSPIRVPAREPSFACPVCKRTIFVGNSSISGRRSRKNSTPSRPQSLEIPPAVEVISDYQRLDSKGVDVHYCEMCEVGASTLAVINCEQCKVRYCEECLQRYHPPRGPLASHLLLRIRHRRPSGRPRSRKLSGSHPSTPTVHELPPGAVFDEYQTADSKQQGIRLASCTFHVVETMTLYCGECCVSLCHRCIEEGRHTGHDIKPIGSAYEAYKECIPEDPSGVDKLLITSQLVKGAVSYKYTIPQRKEMRSHTLIGEYSHSSQKVTVYSRFRRIDIHPNPARGFPDADIDNNYNVMEAKTVAQCNSIIEAVEQKKREMVQLLNAEKERKYKVVRDQLQSSTMKLKHTTGLLEYCIEIMKGHDAAVFLQVSPGLVQKVSATEQQWGEDELVAKASGEMDIDVDCRAVLKTIEEFNVMRRGAPAKPIIKISECSAVNNTVTLSWAAPPLSRVDAYILELDDGSKGPFRDVYHGKQTACTIDGLHFDSVYRARVSAYNKVGRSPCSDIVQLQTSEVAIFRMDPNASHGDIRISHDCCTISCKSTDQKIALANACFSKGIHYWEYSVDEYEASDPDIAVGVATSKVDTNFILGKDVYGWSMYVDSTRTWFLHNNVHTSRIESGVQVGSRLGVLLNLHNQCVTYFVNQKQRGEPISIATDESGSAKSRLFYPAASLNKKVKLTLWSGLRPAFHGKTTAPTDSNKAYQSNTLPSQKSDGPPLHAQFLRPDAGDVAGKKSQSSLDLKNQPGSGERLYHSLPPKLAANKTSLPPAPFGSNQRNSAMGDGQMASGNMPLHFAKPPIPTKPKLGSSADDQTFTRMKANLVDESQATKLWQDDSVES